MINSLNRLKRLKFFSIFSEIIDNVARNVIDFIFPKCCLLCNEFHQNINDYLICNNCWKNFIFSKDISHCYHCGIATKDTNICIKCELFGTNFDDSKSIFLYNDYAKKMVTGLKFNDQTIFAKYIAKIILDSWSHEIKNADFIIPVPIHRRRLLKRKYNQTVMIGKFIEKFTNISLKTNIIQKVKHTKSQSLLSMDERRFNLHDAFIIANEKQIKGAKIILLDDVITTGSTVGTCATILRRYNPDKIIALSFARSILNN